MHGTRALVACVSMSIALYGGAASAYEDDVHYGMSKWLALFAGMSPDNAETFARGDRDIDGGALDAVRLVFFNACIDRDKVGSELVRDHHFPSFASIPGSPEARAVAPGSEAARTLAEDRIARPKAGEAAAIAWNLRQFGSGLHLYQDSYSHQGVPSIPGLFLFNCDHGLAWGHPAKRGGWDSHDADLTYKYQDDAIAMTKGTWKLICAYRRLVQLADCDEGKLWEKLETLMQRFVKASTKASKWNWFRTNNKFGGHFSCEFLEDINLPDGDPNWCENTKYRNVELAAKLEFKNTPPPKGAITSKNPKAFVEATLETLFVKRDLAALANYYVDGQAFMQANAIASFGDKYASMAVVNKFRQWLVRDHGSVSSRLNMKGPDILDMDYRSGITVEWQHIPNLRGRELPTIYYPHSTRLIKYETLRDALYEVSPDHDLFDVRTTTCAGSADLCALAAARPKIAPYETLLLEFRYRDEGWKLVKEWSLVDH